MSDPSARQWTGTSARSLFFTIVIVCVGVIPFLASGGDSFFPSSRGAVNAVTLLVALVGCWVWVRVRYVEITADGVSGRRGLFLRRFTIPVAAIESIEFRNWNSRVLGPVTQLEVRQQAGTTTTMTWLRGPAPKAPVLN